MSVSVSRWAPKRTAAPATGAAPRRTVEQALTDAQPVVFRIGCRYDRANGRHLHLTAYAADGDVIQFDYADHAADVAIRRALIALMVEQFPCVDWSQSHDVHLADNVVFRAPEAWEDAGRRPAVLLPPGQAAWDAPRPWPRAARIDLRRAA